jgi:Fe-Mn family superoxide dismutase
MYPFELPALAYSFDALEQFIDAKTMEIHHDKHHAAYITKLNAALEKHTDLHQMTIEELLMNVDSLPEEIRQSVINNGGGHANHTFFWQILSKEGAKSPSGELQDNINSKFGSVDELKKLFADAATTRFGSGWAWLVKTSSGDLEIYNTPNQDSPLMKGHSPLLGLDVWEHAYYLKYQNRRPEYIEAFWNVVNWDKVNELYIR